jgi:uncharacterized protein (DUF1778 family)
MAFRLNGQHKRLIEKAAALNGQTLSDFAAATLLDKARQVLQAENYRALSGRDARRFLELLSGDVEPNEALRQAARRYKRGDG